MIIHETAPCKVNLYLDVTGRRADGYHGIESVMVSLPLCDFVTLEETDGGISVAMTPEIPGLREEDNLAFHAADLFYKKTGIAGGVSIVIEKHIPERAGLGGGSADAAAVLRGLDRMYGHPLNEEELLASARSLGADVPFCVVGGAALCRGIGDEITKIENAVEFHGVITRERAEKKSTASAYAAVDLAMCRIPKRDGAALASCALEAGDLDELGRAAYNVFGEACGYPTEMRELLSECGAPFVLMSGAGPAVVALTKTEQDAAALYEKIKDRGVFAFLF